MAAKDLKAKRQAGQTARRGPSRQPYDKVLIVCEGEKTEPNYFHNLLKWHDISSVNVRVSGDCGSAPTSVVKYGFELYVAEQKNGEPFDRVYFVFDRDSYHLPSQNMAYQKALTQICSAQPANVFFVANSVPCFEYWLLLHFCESTKQFAEQGKNSVGDMVERELQKYWPEYKKTLAQPYSDLKKLVPNGEEAALKRAERTLIAAAKIGDENPSTKVHLLVEYLINIKNGN